MKVWTGPPSCWHTESNYSHGTGWDLKESEWIHEITETIPMVDKREEEDPAKS